jgi:hypothetical protein
MKHVAFYIICFSIQFVALAQDNLQIQFGYRGSVAASKLLPSTLNLNNSKFEASLHYNIWVANKSVSFGSIRKVYTQNELTTNEVDNIINDLEPENKIGFGQDFMIIGLGLNVNTKKQPIALSFSISDRLNANSYFPQSLMQLLWQGNKQFEGETVDLSNTYVVGMYFREFSIGAATQLIKKENWSLRGGIRLNYYQGLSGITNSKWQFNFYTSPRAEYLMVDHDYEYRYTGIEDFNLFEPRGHGFGVNLGTSVSVKDKFHFDIGISDLGSIKFNNTINRMTSSGSFKFTGFELEDIINPTAFVDSLEQIFTPEIDYNGEYSFRMPVGARLSFMGSWIYGRTKIINAPKTLSIFYTQGFSENPGVTLSPKFTLAVNRPFGRHFLTGVSTTWGGFNNFAIGALAGMHFKHFRFSVQSDDITGLIFPESGTGGGLGFIFQYLM